MKPHSRKYLEDFQDTPPPVPSFRSRDYYNHPRPPEEQKLPPTTTTTTTNNNNNNNGNDDFSSLTEPITRKSMGQPISGTASASSSASASASASMALTVVVLLTVLCFVGFFSFYIHCLSENNPPNDPRRRRHHQTLRDRVSSSGIDPSIIQSLPLFAYDGNVKEPIDCPICLNEFEEKEMVKVIPFCRHVFHPQCIDVWLSAHGSCPLCRSTQLVLPLPFPQQQEVPLPIPIPSSSLVVTRASSFSSSSRLRDGVYLLPRSNSF
ncbi:RING-H2 finger protein ATL11-like [Macadamia integrifolia]|uniref:RING-H2 finger protein ATL11-like n=1 Tax=Macadamia integrifolia TaxID=60698 RepID=UPI001C4FC6A5|nr:RING-H2 finger protein ATL11-like [Macadamia integrifolia]